MSTQWGYRRGPGRDVRIVPSAYTAADVYQKLQEDGRLYVGVKWQIVSREVTDWECRDTAKKTELLP